MELNLVQLCILGVIRKKCWRPYLPPPTPAFGPLQHTSVTELSGSQDCRLGGTLNKMDVLSIKILKQLRKKALVRGREIYFSIDRVKCFIGSAL